MPVYPLVASPPPNEELGESSTGEPGSRLTEAPSRPTPAFTPDRYRTWTDQNERTVDGWMVNVQDEVVTLHTRAGVVAEVPLERLSTVDQQFVRETPLYRARTTPRTWARRDGRKVEATLVEQDATSILIRRSEDQRAFRIARDILSDADQAFVQSLDAESNPQ